MPGQVAGLVPNPFGRVPYSRYLGEPAADRYKLEQGAIGYAFEHRFNNVFQVRQNFRYTDVTNDFQAHRSEGTLSGSAHGRDAASTTSGRRRKTQPSTISSRRTSQPGPSCTRSSPASTTYIPTRAPSTAADSLAPIDAFAPVYGAAVPPADTLAPFIKSTNTQDQVGVYLQDQVKIDRFTLSLTGRHDWADAETVSTAVYPFTGTKLQKDRATTGRVGINYLFDFGLAPYASYTTSFQPVVGIDLSGNVFKPTTGEGKEIGVKFKPFGMNLLLTAAVFEIVQQNVLTADPANVFFSVQTGEAQGARLRVRGSRQHHARARDRRRLQQPRPQNYKSE